ncbi:mucin-binding protein [Ligilactobacillus hayakitensis]|uniref:mucin-binding protein n=1 Tax=Ligilactobacillus hayakitensis TaxID=396716 RepID=UPI000468A914|nr:YSIRK-type signal peptide-containing protein [Ligilactobacillus hayakitensis]
MLSKNNKQQQAQKIEDKKQRFTIKRVSVGVASVLLGATFLMYGGTQASADAVGEVQTGTLASDVVAKDPSTAPKVENSANGTAEPAGATVAHGQAEVTTGINATADVQVNNQFGGGNVGRFDLTINVDPVKANAKAGDQLTLTFEELGPYEAGNGAIDKLPLTLENNGVVFATLKDQATQVTNMVTETGVSGNQSAPYWAQRHGTIEDQLQWHIPNKGLTTIADYILTSEVEHMSEFNYTFHKQTHTATPEVDVDTIHHAVIKVAFNGQEKTIAAKDYLTYGEPLDTPEVITDKSINGKATGSVPLDSHGNIIDFNQQKSQIKITANGDIPTGAIIRIKLNDPEFSKFIQNGEFREFVGMPFGNGTMVNENHVILRDESKPKFKVVSLSDDEFTFELIDGTLRHKYEYTIYDNDGYQFGVKRVLTDKSKQLAQEATAKMRAEGKTKTTIQSDAGATIYITLPGEAEKLQNNQALVNWEFNYDPNVIANDGGNYKSLDGDVIVRYIENVTGKEILTGKPFIKLPAEVDKGLNKDEFMVSEPTPNDVLVDDATNVVDPKKTPMPSTENPNDPNQYFTYYTDTVPYFVKGNDGNVYRFAGFETDNKFDKKDYEATSGAVVVKGKAQVAIVATYGQVNFGSVAIQPVNEKGENLGNEIPTKYDGSQKAINEEGKDYDVKDLAPAEIIVNGKAYILKANQATPANETGKLTAGKTVVPYVYVEKFTITTDDSGKATRTIQYLDEATGLEIPTSTAVKQDATFERTVTTNNADNTTENGDWRVTANGMFAVESPTFDKYVLVDPTQKTVAAVTTPLEGSDDVIKVYYKAAVVDGNQQTKEVTRTIKYLQKDTDKELQAPVTQTVSFTKTDKVNAVTNEVVTEGTWKLVNNGMQAVESPKIIDGNQLVEATDSTVAGVDNPELTGNYDYVVYYEPIITTDSSNEVHTQTINYVDEQGNKIPNVESNVQTTHWLNETTTNEDTKETTSMGWHTVDSYQDVATPKIDGYYLVDENQEVIKGQTPQQEDSVINVVFRQIVQEVPDKYPTYDLPEIPLEQKVPDKYPTYDLPEIPLEQKVPDDYPTYNLPEIPLEQSIPDDYPTYNLPEAQVPEIHQVPNDYPTYNLPEAQVPEIHQVPDDYPTYDLPEAQVPEIHQVPDDYPTYDLPEAQVPEKNQEPNDHPTYDLPEAQVPEMNQEPNDHPTNDLPEVQVPKVNELPSETPTNDLPEAQVPEIQPSNDLPVENVTDKQTDANVLTERKEPSKDEALIEVKLPTVQKQLAEKEHVFNDKQNVLPQTGDDKANVTLVGSVLVAAGSMFGMTSIARKRKEK